VGDPTYGRPLAGHVLSRPFLHAAQLAFVHPEHGEHVSFESALAPELEALLQALGPPDEVRS
ncbi:MAG: hypothetical protein WAR61_10015, partial [Candidatus Microthrix parvicella]